MHLSTKGEHTEFRHERIDAEPPGTSNVICLTVDLTDDGRDDVIIDAKGGHPNLYWNENTPDGWDCGRVDVWFGET